MSIAPPAPELLTPAEAAQMLRVQPSTILRWAHQGRLSVIRTPGGHRRYRRQQVLRILAGTR